MTIRLGSPVRQTVSPPALSLMWRSRAIFGLRAERHIYKHKYSRWNYLKEIIEVIVYIKCSVHVGGGLHRPSPIAPNNVYKMPASYHI